MPEEEIVDYLDLMLESIALIEGRLDHFTYLTGGIQDVPKN
jgi:hypothetical protein